MANIASSNSSNSCMTDEESSQKEELNEEEKIGVLNDFFCNRLLLKRFRKDTRDKAGVPQHVLECERAFNELAQKAVRDTTEGLKLDAMEWVGLCTTFSSKWIDVCHWISPKKLREFFTAHIAAEWVRVEEVPASKEQPPVDLKWYKNPEGCTPVQPCLCPLCNVVCNSLAQYKAHSQGRTHRSLARAYAKKNGGKQPVPCSAADMQKKEEYGSPSPDVKQREWETAGSASGAAFSCESSNSSSSSVQQADLEWQAASRAWGQTLGQDVPSYSSIFTPLEAQSQVQPFFCL
eukprot:TRINITY_DN534_c3_g5_i2.p1 TRINITY_DN534_c3_g5~~TRINITY_DN534_c3_g5_i2.p1  ORF type:complete len:306 (+),score=94.43 TRINITY_DN534_c3_g5_i2:47-919(+)